MSLLTTLALPARIETTRLVLRAPRRADAGALVAHADNPKLAAMMARLPSPYTRADAIGLVEIVARRPDEQIYAIATKADDALIGVIGLTFGEQSPPELGYWLGEAFWRRGLMGEALAALLAAADAAGAGPIAAEVQAENTASLALLDRAGFKRTKEAIGDCGPHRGRLIVTLLREPIS